MSDVTADPSPEVAQPTPEPAAPPLQPPLEFWDRVSKHKIAQWGIAYLGAALALAQGQEFLAHAFDWPSSIGRVLVIALIVGLPVALTLAWYHGHRELRISAGELTIISLLMLIGAVFFTVSDSPGLRRLADCSTSRESRCSRAGATTCVRRRRPATSKSRTANLIAVLPHNT